MFLMGKYGKEGASWHPCEVRGSYGVGVWKAIKKCWDRSLIEPPLKWVMTKGLSFGQIDGVQMNPCVTAFPIYMHWLC